MTRAERRGNRWVINGQKVWTTSAHRANYGLLLARTNVDLPKHKGLAYFILEMRQPGVEVVPLRQMNGHASFNQVFFTDAEVAPEFLVEQDGDGWKIATTTLMHERRGADAMRRYLKPSERPERIYREEARRSRSIWSPTNGTPARRPGRSDHRARQADRQELRSGRSPGNRQADDHVALRRVDRAAGAGGASARASARSRGLARQAGRRATSPAPPTRCTR